MPEDDEVTAAIRAAARRRTRVPTGRTQLAQDAPAPHLNHMIAQRGPRLTRAAIEAWDLRVRGQALIDIAHQFDISIEAAKLLIREAHEAIGEDLKDNVEQNRQLDLARIDGLLSTFYPAAKAGDDKAATLTLKCLERRAKLTGAEPDPSLITSRTNPQNVLVWIQAQLPNINRLVEALPVESAPGAPG